MIINKGFTLIEVMITVAIVGILTGVALPAYQDYTIRAQVTEALGATGGAKAAISEFHANNGRFPSSADLAHEGFVGNFANGMQIRNGVAVATFGTGANREIAGQTLSLRPEEKTAGGIEWFCESTAAQKYLPTSCVEVARIPVFAGVGDYYNGDFSFRNGELSFGEMGLGEMQKQEVDYIDGNGTIHYKPNDWFPVMQVDSNGVLTTFNNSSETPFYNQYFPDGSFFQEYKAHGVLIKDIGYTFDIPASVKHEFDVLNQHTAEFVEAGDESSRLAYEKSLEDLRLKVQSIGDSTMPKALLSLVGVN